MAEKDNLNILVIMCDQLRYDALSCNGNNEIKTRNIDRLADKSIRFSNAFNQSPLCGPTRHSLATGLYPYQHGVVNNILLPFENMFTIAHALKNINYRRCCFGHMHWQKLPDSDAALTNDLYMDHGYEKYFSPPDLQPFPDSKEKFRQWEKMGKTQMYASGPSLLNKEEYRDHYVLHESKEKLKEWSKNNDNFLGWTSFYAPHPPFFPPYEYYKDIKQEKLSLPKELPNDAPEPHPFNKSGDPRWNIFTEYEKRRMKAGYYGLVKMVDDFIGELLDCVDNLNLWENTMIIFTVDHGEQMGDHGRYSKGVMREPSVHIPFMIYHPDYESGVRDQLVEHVDIFPTICDFTGVDIKENIEGKSLRPLLEDKNHSQNWRKFAFSQLNQAYMVRTKNWKLNIYEENPGELYNLSQDPDEFYNLVNKQKYESKVEELEKLLLDRHPHIYENTKKILESERHRKNKIKPKIRKVQVK